MHVDTCTGGCAPPLGVALATASPVATSNATRESREVYGAHPVVEQHVEFVGIPQLRVLRRRHLRLRVAVLDLSR